MSASSAGPGLSPEVAAWSITLAISWPSVCSDSMRACTSRWPSWFSSSAPPTSRASPIRFRMTISRPIRDGGARILGRDRAVRRASGFAVAVADAIKRFDGVEVRVYLAELLAHPFDVAVDRAVVDVDLIVVGRVHQVVAAFDEAGALGQRLQQQELGHRQAHRAAVPQAVVAGGVEGEPATLDRLGAAADRDARRLAFLLDIARARAAQHRLHPLQQQ